MFLLFPDFANRYLSKVNEDIKETNLLNSLKETVNNYKELGLKLSPKEQENVNNLLNEKNKALIDKKGLEIDNKGLEKFIKGLDDNLKNSTEMRTLDSQIWINKQILKIQGSYDKDTLENFKMSPDSLKIFFGETKYLMVNS